MESAELSQMIVGELMRRWPASVPLLLGRRMACPGCPMAPFMTVAEAAREYGIDPDELVRELVAAIEQEPAPAGKEPRP
ncbi:hybrid cluster protein-associated redox disulfide domain-containing protein [Tistlia consotensis]|uniref:Hybrid cluster protein-associated redox disulfide domain-containing protein n=1 Tax=Tistlia consotensis USBA 355 TaxID=560819 RepID=A0A1Y6C8A1_9PROT|nr:DUF1858 domain-containing protein [Tistlia consotensis]SMF51296.1 hybrid cluster protein-associated redox disulfide domain-containing protein [Tistlia consotensis USBA 355]SNR84490.1 hybrid cluster protein-associated redox disulfide domain-containing protein [Tistlia consotensis]